MSYPPPRSEIVVVGGKRKAKCLWEGCGSICKASPMDFASHWRSHTGEKPFLCEYPGCGKAYVQKSGLDGHKRVHTGERPYKCDWPGCDFACSDGSAFGRHRHLHTGQKNYVCDYAGCGMAFAASGNLHSHKRKHTGERPYACDYAGCGKAFAQRFNLVAHVRTHTGTKPYACDYPGCGKAFAQPGNRDIHMRTHTGEKPYVCDVPGCNYASTQPGHLHEHVRIHHNATYVARKKEQEERVRKALLDAGWKEWFHPELLPPAGYFKREHQIDFECAAASADRQFCRIDFILGYDGPSYVFLEVDEHQHRFGFRQADGAAISCDAKRMGSVHTSLAVEFGKLGRDAPPIYWLRYNPHEWHVDGVTTRLPKADREARLVTFLADCAVDAPLRIGYAFYDYSDADGLDVLFADEFPAPFRDDGIVDNLRDFTAGEPELVCLPC